MANDLTLNIGSVKALAYFALQLLKQRCVLRIERHWVLAFPNLLVNGTAGIAVGMATNMAPHNLGEVIAAARHLIANPDATLDELMRFVPGPDLPTGGKIIGLDGIREAYETGRGTFRTRATAKIEQLTPRRSGIVVTELPYGVGPRKSGTGSRTWSRPRSCRASPS